MNAKCSNKTGNHFSSIEFYPSENREVVVDVTQFLQTRNELRIALLNLEGVSPQLTGEVFLEVEDVG